MSTLGTDNGFACPSAKLLQEWLHGDIELLEAQLSHISKCPGCASAMAQLSDDRGLQLLAEVNSVRFNPRFAHEPELQKVKATLSRLPLDASGLHHPSNNHSEEGGSPLESTQRYARREVVSTPNDSCFLDWPSVESISRRLPPNQFIVDRLLAHGGTGAVYLAYDPRLQREVAIKVLARDSFRDRQRFLREARILADLQHPNIVRVFDFGSLAIEHERVDPSGSIDHSGQLYLVMEYVSGGTLGDLSAEALNFRELAALIATAADGLAAAHAKSLVHRDVKPGNLLIDQEFKILKVGDFGLARLVDVGDSQVTRTGDVLGTPVFMSPEQIVCHESITASSDIYSLGATLYQSITGVAPFQGGSASVLRQVVESSPVAPRWINSAIPADLETICLRAMEYEAKSRYASMGDFAADLRRFANGEPIYARPTTSFKRVFRWVKRNKSLASIVAVCVGLVCLLTVGSLVAASLLYRQAKELEISIDKERSSKQNAEEALKASITAADELLLAVTEETEFLPRAPGSQEVTRKLLLKAKDYFRKFLDANSDNPALKVQLARAHSGLATVAIRAGDKAAMEQETEAALALIASVPDDAISPEERASLQSDTMLAFANYLIESGEPKRAIPMLEEAIGLCKRVVDQGSAPSRELRGSYALSIFGLANAFHWIGKNEEATPLLNSAKEKLLKLNLEVPDNHSYLRSAAACDMTLATIALNQNQAAVGKSHLQDALALLQQIREEDAIALRIRELKVKVLTNLALADRRMGQNEEAKSGYETAIAESRRLIELEPSVLSHQWNLVVASLNSGGPDMELGNLETLVERWQSTVPVLDHLISSEPENQRYQQVKAMLQSNIAIILRDMGKLEEAIEPLQAATVILLEQAKRVEYSPSAYLPVALNHYELASTWIQLGRLPDAGVALDESEMVVKEILEKESTFIPALGHWLDLMHSRMSLLKQLDPTNFSKRNHLAEEALKLAKDLSTNNPDVAEYQIELPRAMIDQAEVWSDSGSFSDSIRTVQESRRLINILQESQKSLSPDVRVILKNAFLVEAKTLLNANPQSKERDASIRELLTEAESRGAKEGDLTVILSQLVDEEQK
jgi:serine/threonine protein kinase